VVEHSSHRPRVTGLSPAAASGTGRQKKGESGRMYDSDIGIRPQKS
jgi:hypothetical protein